MSDTPTYDQLSALCAQMAAALDDLLNTRHDSDKRNAVIVRAIDALKANATMSPDPQWQRVPEGYEIVKLPTEQDLFESIASVEVYYDTVQSSSAREIAQDILKRARGEG